MHSLAFRMFDTEGSGHVQVSTLKSVFGRVFRELPDEEVDRVRIRLLRGFCTAEHRVIADIFTVFDRYSG